jgi:hypothetical protein
MKLPVVTAAARGPAGMLAVPSEPPQEKFEVPPPLTIREQLISWNDSPARERLARDPFAWPARPVTAATNAVMAAPFFKLQAISIDADQALAVLNQRVVGAGEKLGEYVVERILPTEVWMRGPAGRVVVRLAR